MDRGAAHPLVGRAGELKALKALLRDTVAGNGRIALIGGEPGIGKTRLLDEAVGGGRAPIAVYRAAADELGTRRPFGAISDCLGISLDATDAARRDIARLLRADAVEQISTSLTTGPQLEFLATEAMIRLVEREAAAEPLCLVLDDLQWADPASLVVLHRIGRHVAQLAALLVVSVRPLPRSSELEHLLDELAKWGAHRLFLTPLAESDVSDLVRDLVGAKPGPNLLRQVAGASGNPFYVTELVGALKDEGAIGPAPGGGEDIAATATSMPSSMTLAILHRLRFLPEETLDVLRVAAVLGRRFSVTDLSLALGQPAVGLLEILRTSMRAGILGEFGDGLAFRHDLIREALYHDVPAPVRAGLHLEVGRALAAAGAPTSQIAEHLARGASKGDRLAVEWLIRASREAAPRAPAVAVDLLEKALELADASDPSRDGLLADIATAYMWSGRVADAEQLCREILGRDHDLSVEGRLRTVLVHAIIAEGRTRESLEELEAAMDSPTLSEQERAQMRAWGAHAHMLLGNLDSAVEMAGQAQGLGRQIGDDLSTCMAMACIAMVTNIRGDFSRAVDTINEAVDIADRSPDRVGHRFQLNLLRGLFVADLDDILEGEASMRRGSHISEELGAKWQLPLYQIGLTFGHFLAGRWDDAIAEFEAGLELADEIGTRHGMVFSNSIRALIALHRNDLGAADGFTSAGERELAGTGPQWKFAWVKWARALLLETAGNVADAYESLSGTWDLCANAGIVNELPGLGPDLVRLAMATDASERADAICVAIEQLASKNNVASLAGAALRCRGLLRKDADTMLGAVAAFRATSRPLDLALACEEAAGLLGAAGRNEEARALFEEAIQTYQRLEAARDEARVEARMRVLSIRRGRRGPHKRATHGWESLTESEAKVVALVAEGLSNPEIAERLFISRFTVRTHLTHIFTKLGISSRTQLAAAAIRTMTNV